MSDIDEILASARPNQPEPASLPAASGSIVKVAKPPVLFDNRAAVREFLFNDLEGAFRLAQVYLSGGMVPESTIKDCPNERAALARIVAIIAEGKALGIRAQAALQYITAIRGRIMLWGDLPVALCQRHPAWRGLSIEWSGDLTKGDRCCEVTVFRDGCPAVTQSFSQADQKRAGLSGNVWAGYTDRMLFNRARAWALRDQFADALSGISIGEEMMETTEVSAAVSADEAMRLMNADATKALED